MVMNEETSKEWTSLKVSKADQTNVDAHSLKALKPPKIITMVVIEIPSESINSEKDSKCSMSLGHLQ